MGPVTISDSQVVEAGAARKVDAARVAHDGMSRKRLGLVRDVGTTKVGLSGPVAGVRDATSRHGTSGV